MPHDDSPGMVYLMTAGPPGLDACAAVVSSATSTVSRVLMSVSCWLMARSSALLGPFLKLRIKRTGGQSRKYTCRKLPSVPDSHELCQLLFSDSELGWGSYLKLIGYAQSKSKLGQFLAILAAICLHAAACRSLLPPPSPIVPETRKRSIQTNSKNLL